MQALGTEEREESVDEHALRVVTVGVGVPVAVAPVHRREGDRGNGVPSIAWAWASWRWSAPKASVWSAS